MYAVLKLVGKFEHKEHSRAVPRPPNLKIRKDSEDSKRYIAVSVPHTSLAAVSKWNGREECGVQKEVRGTGT